MHACVQESLVAEGQFEELREGTQRKYEQSTVDLQTALDIQNRTTVLQRFTQNQLLQLESKSICTIDFAIHLNLGLCSLTKHNLS